MGGFGSGFSGVSNVTVEECLPLPVGAFARQGLFTANTCHLGELEWQAGAGKVCVGTVTFWVVNMEGISKLTLEYTSSGQPKVQEIRLGTTPLPNRGYRRWVMCDQPLRPAACGVWVSKLYLSPAYPYFACRNCLSLTYVSCQQSHCRSLLGYRLRVPPPALQFRKVRRLA